MAYTTPEQWSHGDIPTAAKMNAYSDSLNAIYALLSAVEMPAQLWNYRYVNGSLYADSDQYCKHLYRWLIYRGDGEISDPSGAGEDVHLTGSGTSILTYDLDQIEWMTPGKLYKLGEFYFAVEDRVP